MNNPLSYQINLLLEPNWRKIATWLFPQFKTEKEAGEYLSKLINKYKVDQNISLYLNQFGFVEFYDAVSGLNPIWSNRSRSFVPHLETSGWFLIDEDGKIENELASKNRDGAERSLGLSISPHRIATDDGEVISKIPYDDIINLLVQIQKETGLAHREIKKFPENFRKIFDENNISYEADFDIYTRRESNADPAKHDLALLNKIGVEMSDQTVEAHVFKTPYYSIWFNAIFFKPGGLRPETTDLSPVHDY